jgi:hypothetical protein
MSKFLYTLIFVLGTFSLSANNYGVTNNNDSGDGSLRAAIEAANADVNTPHTITFDQALTNQTITLSSMIFITNSMTIEGLGVDQLTISGGGSTRIFWIQNGTTEIKDLTLANGYARGGNGGGRGGGGMGAGGAIFMHEGSKNGPGSVNLTLTNVAFEQNVAIGGNGSTGSGSGSGGGMGGDGANSRGGGGGIIGKGGIDDGGGGSVTDGQPNGGAGGTGNAIFGNGGDGNFNGNGENGGFGGGGGGGALGGNGGFGGGGGGNSFVNSALGNGGFGGGGGANSDGGFGGGGGSSPFEGGMGGFGGSNGGNSVSGGGMGAGGAIFVASGSLSINNVIFSNNTATGGNGASGLGGAIFVFDKADNGDVAADQTGQDPQVSSEGCLVFFNNNSATNDAGSNFTPDGSTKNNNDDVYGFITCTPASTEVSLSGGDLLIEDIDGADSDDLLTLKKDGTNLLICDPNQILLAGNEVSQVNANCVSVPCADITGKIVANTLGGNDLLTLDFSMGDFIPAEGLEFSGGSQTSGFGDALAIEGGSFNTVDYGYLNENDGSVELDGTSTITYTGLEPISSTINAANISLNFGNSSETINFTDAGGGSVTVDSDAGEFTTFPQPSTSLSIDAGMGTDVLNLENGLNLISSLILDVETVNLNGTNAGSLTAAGLELSATSTLNIDLNGTAPGTGYDQYSISVNINLNNASLQVAANFSPPIGTQFVIIDNTGGTTTGEFNGFPEGSVVAASVGRNFVISYANDDVTISVVEQPIPTMGQWAFLLFGLVLMTVSVVGVYNFSRKRKITL